MPFSALSPEEQREHEERCVCSTPPEGISQKLWDYLRRPIDQIVAEAVPIDHSNDPVWQACKRRFEAAKRDP